MKPVNVNKETLEDIETKRKQEGILWKYVPFECVICGKVFTTKKACKSRLPKVCSEKCNSYIHAKPKTCIYCKKKYINYQNKDFCSRACCTKWRKGKKLSVEHRASLSKAKKGKPIKHFVKNKEKIRKKISDSLKRYWENVERPPLFPNKHITHWKKFRDILIKRHPYCHRCGETKGALHVHHIIPYNVIKRHSIKNLVILCPRCHGIIEFNAKQVYKIIKDWDITSLLYRLKLEDKGKALNYEMAQ